MKKRAQLLTMVILTIFIASCSTQVLIPSTAESKTDATQIPQIRTRTPSPVSKVTTTVINTSTIEPTLYMQVETLEALVAEYPELKPFYSRGCILTGMTCWGSGLGFSPNQEWAVFFTTPDNTGGLKIINVQDKTQRQLSYLDVTRRPYDTGTLRVEHWSKDGRYLYLSPQVESSGGDFWFWRESTQLIRLDLSDGTWMDTNMGSAYTFSPDDQKIAFRRGNQLIVYNLQTGQERMVNIPAEYVIFGRFIWSADNEQILFVSSPVKEMEDPSSTDIGFTLFQVNIIDMQLHTIVDKDKRCLYPIEWLSEAEILLGSFFESSPDGNVGFYDETLLLDLLTNTITEYETP
jgi:hypothetical protein